MLKAPDWIPVPRAALKDARLDVRDALALGLALHRTRLGYALTAADCARVMAWDGSTAWRALRRLQDTGYLCSEGRAEELCADGGWLRVRTARVRELGNWEALALQQLESFGELRMARSVGGRLCVAGRQLAALIGCCRDTARAVLERLSTGVTVRARRALRAGQSVTTRAHLEVSQSAGQSARVRVLPERELQTRVWRPPVAPEAAPLLPRDELQRYWAAGITRAREHLPPGHSP